MSPKSRGRPKGRGRQPAKHTRPVRGLKPIDHLLAEAGTIPADFSVLQAQAIASAWLGGAWATREPGRRDAEGEIVSQVVAATSGRRARAAWTALHMLATIPDPGWRDAVVEALATCPPDQRPRWAVPIDRAPEQPVLAERWADPWDDERVSILRYQDPEPHVVLMRETRAGGRYVHELVVGEQTEPADDVVGHLTRDDATAAEILADIARAMADTDMYWPPQDEPAYYLDRALVRWRTLAHLRAEDWEPIPVDERHRLIEEFADSLGGGLDRDVVEELADTFVEFGDGYLVGGVFAWSPNEVERFLLDWAQRKVMLEPETSAALPEVLEHWVRFALTRAGVAEEYVDAVAEIVQDLADEYHELQEDEEAGGPARQIASRLLAAGVDLSDRAAVDAAIGQYNAEMLARRLLE